MLSDYRPILFVNNSKKRFVTTLAIIDNYLCIYVNPQMVLLTSTRYCNMTIAYDTFLIISCQKFIKKKK